MLSYFQTISVAYIILLFVVLFRNSLWGVVLHLYPYVRKKIFSISSPSTFSTKYYLRWWPLYITVTEVTVKTIRIKEMLLSWTLSNYRSESSWAPFWGRKERRKEKVMLLELKRRKDQKQSMHVRFLYSVKGNTVYSSKNSRLNTFIWIVSLRITLVQIKLGEPWDLNVMKTNWRLLYFLETSFRCVHVV